MANTHGISCPCEMCGGIRETLTGSSATDAEKAALYRRVITATFWKIVAPQIHEHWQHVLSEAFRITENVKGMEDTIDKQLTQLWKGVDNGEDR